MTDAPLESNKKPMPMSLRTLDQPPPGWHVITVLRTGQRGWDWCALMIDELESTTARCAYVRIAGKHRSRQAAWDALDDVLETLLETRH
jgi:hypothetical protein